MEHQRSASCDFKEKSTLCQVIHKADKSAQKAAPSPLVVESPVTHATAYKLDEYFCRLIQIVREDEKLSESHKDEEIQRIFQDRIQMLHTENRSSAGSCVYCFNIASQEVPLPCGHVAHYDCMLKGADCEGDMVPKCRSCCATLLPVTALEAFWTNVGAHARDDWYSYAEISCSGVIDIAVIC
jgi:hypothetical protein